METTCQSYWPTMKSSMFIITDCFYGNNGWLVINVKTDFLPLTHQNPFLKWTKTHIAHGRMYKRRQTRSLAQTHTTKTNKDKQTYLSIFSAVQCVECTHTRKHLHNQQAALQVSPNYSMCFCARELILQCRHRKHNSLSAVIRGSQMSSQHVRDPQMIIRCSGLRGVANNELSVRLGTDRQAGGQTGKLVCR